MKNEGKSFPTFKEFYTEQSTFSKIGQGVGKAVGTVAAAPFKLAGGLLKGIGSAFKKTPATPAAAPTPKPAAVTTPTTKPSANIRGEAPGAQASFDDVYGKPTADPFAGTLPKKPGESNQAYRARAASTKPKPAAEPPASTTPATTAPATTTPATTTPATTTPATTTPASTTPATTTPATTTPATTTPASTAPSVYDKEISAYNEKEPTTPTTPTSPPIAPITPGAPPPKGMGLNPDAEADMITVGGTGPHTGLQKVFINPNKTTASDTMGNKFIRDTINSPWRRMKPEEDTGVTEVDQLPPM